MSIDKIVYKSWISYNPAAKEKCSLVINFFYKTTVLLPNAKAGHPFYNCRTCNCLCTMIARDSTLPFSECRTIYVSHISFEFKSAYI